MKKENPIEETAEDFERTIDEAEKKFVAYRKTAFERFPVPFILAVTVGVGATFLGIEELIKQVAFLNERPLLIFISGVSILIITGTLYKKLG